MKRFAVFLVTLLIAFSGLAPVLAQDEETETAAPTPGATAVQYLPAAAELGSDWNELPPTAIADLDPGTFRESAIGSYGSSSGARVVITVLVANSARLAARDGWDAASSAFNQYRRSLSPNMTPESDLEFIDPPAGCEDVKRAEGTDPAGFASAVTLCGGSGDVIVLAIASGGVDNPAAYQASDALASLVIQTPVDAVAEPALATPEAGVSLNEAPMLAGEIPVAGAVMGNPEATVTLTEWGDNSCPHCRDFATEIQPQLIDDYVAPGLIKFEYRDYPFINEGSNRSAEAAFCAGQQNQFWNFHNLLFANQDNPEGDAYTDERLLAIAEQTGLDTDLYTECMLTDAPEDAVAASVAEGEELGINSTPSLFINGEAIDWQDWDQLKSDLDAALKAGS